MGNPAVVQVQANRIGQVRIFTIDINPRKVLSFLILSVAVMVFMPCLMAEVTKALVIVVIGY